MRLLSPSFEHDDWIPVDHTCDGRNESPPLEWSGVPDDAVELAVTCEDPDAPSGTFVHWVAWGIDPSGALPAGTRPEGVHEGRNDFGAIGYGGACPPPGHDAHRYRFHAYALGEHCELPDGATIDQLRQSIADSVVAEAELVARYQR